MIKHAIRASLISAGLCLALAGSRPAAADPASGDGLALALSTVASRAGEPARDKRPRRYDYSRFSNGPRDVPRARGASLRRAEALGIGDLKSTRKLLRGPVPQELLAAVPGGAPDELLWPVVGGHWGRGFGYTRRLRRDLRHNGLDIGAKPGAVVRAAAEGLVIYSDNTLRGLGNAVVVLHPGGWTTLYAHNSRNTVQPGWRVRRGERIALVGQTGIARGPHLHFELRKNGRLHDPARLLVGQRSDELEGPLVELGE